MNTKGQCFEAGEQAEHIVEDRNPVGPSTDYTTIIPTGLGSVRSCRVISSRTGTHARKNDLEPHRLCLTRALGMGPGVMNSTGVQGARTLLLFFQFGLLYIWLFP